MECNSSQCCALTGLSGEQVVQFSISAVLRSFDGNPPLLAEVTMDLDMHTSRVLKDENCMATVRTAGTVVRSHVH